MKRICVLGNSHVGTLRRAWDGPIGSEYADKAQLTFFAARGALLHQLELSDGKLVSSNEDVTNSITFTSGGLGEITIGDYDLFLISSLGLRDFPIPEGYYSQAVLKALLEDRYKPTIAYRLLRMIREVADTKIVLGLAPIAACTDDDMGTIEASEAYFNSCIDSMAFANQQFFAPWNAELMGQPRSTLTANGRHTLPHFTKNSRRLSIGDGLDDQIHPDTDRIHMNEDYGSLWLHDFFAKVL